jgi:hypothetical protein
MKKFLLMLMVSAFGTVSLVNAQSVAKKPFVEHFTQASCGPCASQNPTMYTTLNTFGTSNYCKLTYQTSWPGTDPMNAAYAAGPSARVSYYNVGGVPDASLNGGATASPNAAVTSSTLSTAAALTTSYQIDISQTWNSGTSITIDLKVKNVSAAAVSSADRLYLAMVEDHVQYASAPGSNGETDFYYVLRQFYNASTGAASNAGLTIGSIPAGDSLVYNFTLTSLPGYIRDLNQVSFVAFLQNNSSKLVEQSEKTLSGSVPGLLDVSSSSTSTAGAGYCDLSFSPVVSFTNNGATAVTTVTAEYTINGGTPVSQTFNGTLSQGQSTTIAFPATSLAAGTSTVDYSITDINNGASASSPAATDIPSESYYKLNATGSVAPVAEGMETAPLTTGTGYSRILTTGIMDAPSSVAESSYSILDGPTYNYGAIGGFAQSNRSVRFRFFALNGSEQLDIVMQKVNLGTGSKVDWSHAYRQYANENDRLQVHVSTDCGSTWTSVWDKAGSALATLPASTTQYVPSAASDWVADSVDLAAYDNTNDVVIRFRGTSAYGNNMFLDDINITSSSVTAVEDLQLEEVAEIKIMPNPVSNHMTVQFTTLSLENININVVNTLGQKVLDVATGTFDGLNNIQVNTSDLVSGVYFLNVNSANGTSTKRFVVEK